MHLAVGEAFLSQEEDPTSVCNAAVHLNQAPEFCKTVLNRAKLASINFQASKHCKDKSSFPSAARFLRRCLESLSEEEKWSEPCFRLTYDMMESLAKRELVVGNFDEGKEVTKQTLRRGKSVEMKIPSLLIDIEVLVAGQELSAVIAIATKTLRILGVRIPWQISIYHVFTKFLRVKRMLTRMADADMIGLPQMQDLSMSTAVRILADLSMSCFLQHKLKEGVFASMLAVQLTLQGGLSGYSAYALGMYGVAEAAMGNHARGFRYGKLALTLLDRIKCSDAECPTVRTALLLVSRWKQSFAELVDPLLRQ
jgi:predicted ATPase